MVYLMMHATNIGTTKTKAMIFLKHSILVLGEHKISGMNQAQTVYEIPLSVDKRTIIVTAKKIHAKSK